MTLIEPAFVDFQEAVPPLEPWKLQGPGAGVSAGFLRALLVAEEGYFPPGVAGAGGRSWDFSWGIAPGGFQEGDRGVDPA